MDRNKDSDREQLLNDIEVLKRNQAVILDHLNLNTSSSGIPSSTLTAPSAVATADSQCTENVAGCPPAPKKRRKTISRKYSMDPQKLLTYGGTKIHLQVKIRFERNRHEYQ